MSDEIGAALRREVRERAHSCCEYGFMSDDEPVFPHEPAHIIALQHGGKSVRDNLAYACFECNRAKGSDIGSIDPVTNALTPLFHPRRQHWREHFHFNGPLIEPISAEGRVTVMLLRINAPKRVKIRSGLLQEGRYPSILQDE